MGIGQHRSQFSSHRCRNKFLRNMAKILSDAEVFEQFSDDKSRKAYRRCWERFVACDSEFDFEDGPLGEELLTAYFNVCAANTSLFISQDFH